MHGLHACCICPLLTTVPTSQPSLHNAVHIRPHILAHKTNLPSLYSKHLGARGLHLDFDPLIFKYWLLFLFLGISNATCSERSFLTTLHKRGLLPTDFIFVTAQPSTWNSVVRFLIYCLFWQSCKSCLSYLLLWMVPRHIDRAQANIC